METVLALVRHGETDWNAAGRYQGHRDIPLNARGREQAQRLARRLAREKWDAIYCSDLIRARDTARIIGQQLGIPPRVDRRWRERDVGALEGRTQAELEQVYGLNWRHLKLGEESDERLISRIEAALADIIKTHHGGRVIVVSHGGAIRAACRYIACASDEEIGSIGNTAVKEICYKAKTGWRVRCVARAGHLEDAG